MIKILVWGVRGTWRYIKEYIDYDEVDIIGFLDNDPPSNALYINGNKVPVYLPADYFIVNREKYDKILIASLYFEKIQNQLIKCFGIDPSSIETYQNPNKVLMKASYFRDRENEARQDGLYKKICTQMHLQAKLLNYININRRNIQSIQEVEYKVYSQWGEDGIIQYLIHKIPIKNKTFIEFGVENYQEANTRFLLEENNWSGMIIDGNADNISEVRKEELYWRYDLQAMNEFITKDNINELLMQSGFDFDLGLLSVDIDGNDYWILKEINGYKPRILICEYNAIYGKIDAVTVPYKENFHRTNEHFSNLHFGASLEAIKLIAKEKGYYFIGTNNNACNAFFIREDLIMYLPKSMIENNIYLPYKYRQARDENGQLLFLHPREEVALIANQEVYDVCEKKIKKVYELNLEC